jgi:hypothetical protein
VVEEFLHFAESLLQEQIKTGISNSGYAFFVALDAVEIFGQKLLISVVTS